jgi:hypothetical protein
MTATVIGRADISFDMAGVSRKLAEMGIVDVRSGEPIPVDRIRNRADHGKLPFFTALDGKRRISEAALVEALRRMQSDASKPRRRRRA